MPKHRSRSGIGEDPPCPQCGSLSHRPGHVCNTCGYAGEITLTGCPVCGDEFVGRKLMFWRVLAIGLAIALALVCFLMS